MEAQDSLSKKLVQGLPGYKKFLLSFYRANAFDRFSSPLKKGDYWYYTANFGGLLNQNILYRTRNLDSKYPEVFLNPNELSPGGVDQVDGWIFSPDNSLMAFVSTKNETDYGYIGFRNISNGQPFDTVLRYTVRYLGEPIFEWQDEGVIYTHYDNPNLEWTTAGRNNDAFPMKMSRSFHRFGTPQSEDIACGSVDIDPSKPPPNIPPVCIPKRLASQVLSKRDVERDDEECEEWEEVSEEPAAPFMNDRIARIAPKIGAASWRSCDEAPPTIRLRKALMDPSSSQTFYRHPASPISQASGESVSSSMTIEEAEMLVMGVTPVKWTEEGVFVGQVVVRGGEGGVKERVMSIYKTAAGAPRFRLLGVDEEERNEDGMVTAYEVLGEHEEYTLDETHLIDREEGFMFVTYIADVT
ncbi:hypothetical protein HDU67_003999, partial [Dinochytrium kinnereticum]